MQQGDRPRYQRCGERCARAADQSAHSVRYQDRLARRDDEAVQEPVLRIADAIVQQTGCARRVGETRNHARWIDRADHDDVRVGRPVPGEVGGLDGAFVSSGDDEHRVLPRGRNGRVGEHRVPVLVQRPARNAKRHIDHARALGAECQNACGNIVPRCSSARIERIIGCDR